MSEADVRLLLERITHLETHWDVDAGGTRVRVDVIMPGSGYWTAKGSDVFEALTYLACKVKDSSA